VSELSEKTKKRFGVWLDNHHATVVGTKPGTTEFTVLGQAKNPGPGANSNENAANNLEITLVRKYFKDIGHHLENADEVHLTGTGTIQEQFSHYLKETPQFKKTVVSDSTSNQMSDEKLVEFVRNHFN
jgi:stalled ribosome rescue protein Dom34